MTIGQTFEFTTTICQTLTSKLSPRKQFFRESCKIKNRKRQLGTIFQFDVCKNELSCQFLISKIMTVGTNFRVLIVEFTRAICQCLIPKLLKWKLKYLLLVLQIYLDLDIVPENNFLGKAAECRMKKTIGNHVVV